MVAPERHASPTERRVTAHLRTTRASRIVDADPSVAWLMRRHSDSIVGKPLAVLVPMDMRSEFRSRLALLPEGGRIDDWAFDVLTPAGEAVRVIAQVVAMPAGEDDEASLDWKLIADPGEQGGVAAKDEPTEATLSDVAARLGHELNQPLAAIVSYARGAMLRSQAGTLTPADLEHVLSIIIAEAMRVADRLRRIGTREERST